MALGALIWWVATPSHPSGPTAASANSLAVGAREVRQATTTVTKAGTVMSRQMADIHSLPTVASVSAAVDPYLTALQRYQRALTGPVLIPAADNWRRNILVHLHSLETLLGDLTNTPSAELGSWINGFYLQTAELQNAIQGLDIALPNGSGS